MLSSGADNTVTMESVLRVAVLTTEGFEAQVPVKCALGVN